MARPLPPLNPALPSAFTRSEAVAAGVRRQRLRGGPVFAKHPGVGERELVLAFGRTLPPGWALSHDAAALVWGLPLPARRPPAGGAIEITLHASGPERNRPRSGGCVFHESGLASCDVVHVAGAAVTAVARTVADLAAGLPLLDLIAVVDSALRRGISTAQLAAEQQRLRRGALRYRKALELADGRAETAQESRCRLLIVSAGMPMPIPQQDCFGPEGQLLGRADLLIEEFATVVEHLGRDHFDADRTEPDYDPGRRARFHRAGYEYVELTSASVLRAPMTGVLRVADALRAKGWRGAVDHRALEKLLAEDAQLTAARRRLAAARPPKIIRVP
jgi:hypothetical protein